MKSEIGFGRERRRPQNWWKAKPRGSWAMLVVPIVDVVLLVTALSLVGLDSKEGHRRSEEVVTRYAAEPDARAGAVGVGIIAHAMGRASEQPQ